MNRNRTSATVLVCCLAIAIPMTAIAADIVGTVARVMDGNTFEIASPKDSIVRIRLCGVHSPERSEPNYRSARRLLSEKIEKREIRCVRVVAKAQFVTTAQSRPTRAK
jgi:endonuclease YncB( thermonuclease family)